jgi:choline dehydrogenase-like flavoprotein
MFIDARSIPDGSLIETDICIVGAGAAGIALAQTFVGKSTRVCLLESGGLASDWEAQSLAEGETVGLPYSDLDSCQIRYFGGNSNAWGGWFRGLDEIDYRQRPWVENSGWPFGPAELAPYFEAAHGLCQVASADYDLDDAVARIGDPRARLLPFDKSKLESILYRFSPPTRFGQVYREALEKAANIKCLTHAHALGIETSDDARVATRLKVGCLPSGRIHVAAKIFVLAAGAIENARLLLLSNEVMACGLGNQHDLVGRYFMDHPHTKRELVCPGRPPTLGLYGLSFRDRGIAAGISLSATTQEEERLLNYKASIYPVYRGQDSRGWAAFRNLVLSLDPRWRSDPYDRFSLPFARKQISARQIWNIVREIDKVAIGALLQLRKPEGFVARLHLESKPEQAPNPDSRVTLQGARDAFGLNRARVDWRLLPIDRRTMARAEEIIAGELSRLGIGRLAPMGRGAGEDPPDLVGGWHQIGTTRAHVDPRQGVVDAQLGVHGMANLFVAGASAFPTGGAVSPTPTLLALTLRLADHLDRRLSMGPSALSTSPAALGEGQLRQAFVTQPHGD